MIVGIFHQGSGLGDQLMRYITVRTLAQDKGLDYGMVGRFKGEFFLNQPNIIGEFAAQYTFKEKDVRDSSGNDIRSYDPEINFIRDNTIIEGSFEDDTYWRHNLRDISKWLEVEPLNVLNDTCIIGFRGGEYYSDPNLGLPKEYYTEAIDIMRSKGITHFEVHTDDENLALRFFNEERYNNQDTFKIIPNQQISHSNYSNMAFNWRSMRFAKHAIIPNSAFFILPRILRHYKNNDSLTIAPRYWARRNTKTWCRPGCYYPEFSYI